MTAPLPFDSILLMLYELATRERIDLSKKPDLAPNIARLAHNYRLIKPNLKIALTSILQKLSGIDGRIDGTADGKSSIRFLAQALN